MSAKKFFVLATILSLFLSGCVKMESNNNTTTPVPTKTVTQILGGFTPSKKNITVLFKTNYGDFKLEVFSKDLPITAGNFEKLVKQKFYDGTKFHRVIADFMVQGGDPVGNGTGGPGYNIPDEFSADNQNDRGTIAMANAGPNTGGSQFFINVVNNNYLDGKHPVFGKVISGMDVVDKISKLDKDASDAPLKDVIIKSITIVKK